MGSWEEEAVAGVDAPGGESRKRRWVCEDQGARKEAVNTAEEIGSGEGLWATKREAGFHTELAACQCLSPAVISGCLALGRSPESRALIQGLRQ